MNPPIAYTLFTASWKKTVWEALLFFILFAYAISNSLLSKESLNTNAKSVGCMLLTELPNTPPQVRYVESPIKTAPLYKAK
jgi:hypothetical protein